MKRIKVTLKILKNSVLWLITNFILDYIIFVFSMIYPIFAYSTEELIEISDELEVLVDDNISLITMDKNL